MKVMKEFTLLAPAKLNLYLRVVNKRPDGYHNLVTLFERINLCDRLTFKGLLENRIKIICNNPQVPIGVKNLVYRVALRLKEDFKVSQGVLIKIDKKIPVAAGLAGGSTNAATALVGLNKLWRLGLSHNDLIRYGKTIGADVPFFLHDASWGLGTGRGDDIKVLPIKAKLWHVLATPCVRMYTPKVFQGLNLKIQSADFTADTNLLTKKDDDVNILLRCLGKNDLFQVGQLFRNDLEISAFRLCSKLINLKERLRSFGALGVSLSGSGPSIFGLTESQKQAEDIQRVLLKYYSRVFVVRTL